MEQLILIVHVIVAIGIIALILIQQGKGADMGASFGGGSSQAVFGAGGGGNMLTKATAALATLFFISSFGLAIVAKDKASEVVTVGESIAQQASAVEAAPEIPEEIPVAVPATQNDIPE